MYRLGHQIRHHYWVYMASIAVMLGLIFVLILSIHHIIQPNSVITQSKAITHYYSADNTPTQHVAEKGFSMSIPVGWKPAQNIDSPYQVFSWQGTGTDADRRIDVYIGNIPTKLAVNRLLPVQVNGDQLQAIGSVSDNCTTFTTPTAQSTETGMIDAKWDGVDFTCDVANYERDVVGIGSATGVITMTGPTTGSHQVLLVYTDNTTQPDFTIFTAIAQSFQIL